MVTIRAVSHQDDPQVKALITGILEKEFPAEERAFLSTDIESVSKNYGDEGDAFFVACDDRVIVGTVGIKREDERSALLRRIFVEPEYRRKKIGSQLILSAIGFCKEKEYKEIIFKTTSRMQDAIRLCQATGFIRRATIQLGSLDLFKFTLRLGGDSRQQGMKKNTGEQSVPRRKGNSVRAE